MKLLSFGRAEFSEADVRKLSELINSPEGKARLAEADKAKVEVRAELRRRLDALPQEFAAQIEDAGAKCWDAERHLEELRKLLPVKIREAEELRDVARGAVFALEQAKAREELDIKRELFDSRDTRLDDYRAHISHALSMVNHFSIQWPVHTGMYYVHTGKPVIRHESNNKEVLATMGLLKNALKRLEDIALSPLTRTEIDESLTAISRDLTPSLQKFNLPIPILSANGEVDLTTPRLRTYYALQAAGAATTDDTQQMHVIAAGGSVLGDRGARRVRSARASGNAWGRSTEWLRHRNDIDDLDSK
ncbi:hypothetical protein QZM97_23740 [Burkholderia orbicola]|uniref:hypothetical protein n=1 Tax=Burkholderia orbicola TaxID=2978683 RepID=UPI00264F8635|nr:hypothetical protein [Burkholderia orbicola]MDN7993091.1 hypothetical protein [Burkholderia orbicola]